MAGGEIVPYESTDFGSIRVLDEGDEVWFVANDVAKGLGYDKAAFMARSLDEDEKGVRTVHTLGGPQEMTVINEPGLYHAILRRKTSCVKNTSARVRAERFQRWVTHEVLPSIRRHGAYVNPDGAESDEELIARALEAAHAVIARRERRIAALESENEDMRPMAELGEAVAGSEGSIPIGDLARILHQAGVEIGRNRLFARLRADGYLMGGGVETKNRPYQRYVEQGLFEVRESTFTKPDGSVRTSIKTTVTGKGQAYFVERYACARELGVTADA